MTVNSVAKPGQHTFRVAVRPSKPQTASDANVPRATRRAHNKSRGGCERCKKRRRKCDEKRPNCSYCAKKSIKCVYPELDHDHLHLAAIVSKVNQTLWPGAYSPTVLTDDSTMIQHTNHDLFLIHHFAQTSAGNLENEHMKVYSTSGMELAKQCPYLMHAMIALSACHIQHIGIDARRYRSAEAFHCHLASQGLRNAVSNIKSTDDADCVLTTAMLLNTLTFCAADYRDEAPYLGQFSGQPRFDWLRIQIGLTDLLMRTQPYRPDSIWRSLFNIANDRSILGPVENNLGEELARFCGLEGNENPEDDVYLDMVERLAPLVSRKTDPNCMLLYLQPIGAMTSRFVRLLEAHDTRALMLFAHWLRLMCSVEAWWCVRRTRRECWVICDILSRELAGKDLELLTLPAMACGIWEMGYLHNETTLQAI